MENRGIKLVGVVQMDHGGFKELLVGAVFGPAIVPLVDVRPVEFVLSRLELVPLKARVQDIQDIVENLVEGEFRLRTFCRLPQVWNDVVIELPPGDLRGDRIVEELAMGLSSRLGAHNNVPTSGEIQDPIICPTSPLF
jgi:hypothetical protein